MNKFSVWFLIIIFIYFQYFNTYTQSHFVLCSREFYDQQILTLRPDSLNFSKIFDKYICIYNIIYGGCSLFSS